jgi:adenylylsulfate kinase
MIVWLTGLPCSGKTTLGREVSLTLELGGLSSHFLDGDVVRHDLWPELGFSREHREESVRRFGRLAGMFSDHGIIAVVAAVSPYRSSREQVRSNTARFVEVYVNAPVDLCELRDMKGMYRLARAGMIASFTGISDPYEPPLSPDVECCTELESVEESVDKILKAIYDVPQ